MIFSLKHRLLLGFTLIGACVNHNSFVYAEDDDDYGDIFFDDLDVDFNEGAHLNITRTEADYNALNFYTTVAPINNIITNSVYLKTNPINNRSLESLPNYQIYHSDQLNKDFLFDFYLLYNETFKQNFTAKSTDIGDYLNLNTQDYLDKIESSIFNADELPNILDLFQTGKVQERRVGFLFQLFKNYHAWSFDATTPLTYQENNFYFSDSEQSIIEKEISKITGTTSSSTDRKFFEKLFVSDRIGFGNLKLKAGYLLANNDYLKLKTGPCVILPTSFSFYKGLIGSNFRKAVNTPTVNLTEIYNIISEIQALPVTDPARQVFIDELKAYGATLSVQFANRLGAIVLDQSLGNWHHFTIGGFFDSKLVYNQHVSCLLYGELLYPVPKNELRFFNQIKNPADFTTAALTDPVNALPPGSPEQYAQAAIEMNFLDVNAVSSLFPTATNAKVSPGLELQFNIGPRFEAGAYLLHLGYNFWHCFQERIGKVELIDSALYPLNINDGIRPVASQQKVFGRFNYSMITPKHIWMVAVCVDQTFGSTGIGKDSNIALELSVDF